MCFIECKKSKNGNIFYVLTVNGVYVSFEHTVIMRVARTNGYNERDVYSLDIDEKIEIGG